MKGFVKLILAFLVASSTHSVLAQSLPDMEFISVRTPKLNSSQIQAEGKALRREVVKNFENNTLIFAEDFELYDRMAELTNDKKYKELHSLVFSQLKNIMTQGDNSTYLDLDRWNKIYFDLAKRHNKLARL